MNLSYDILNIPKPDSLLHYDINISLLLTDFYTTMGDMPLSRKYINRALDLLDRVPAAKHFDEEERSRMKSICLRSSAGIYLEEGKLDSAYAELVKSRKFHKDDVGVLGEFSLLAEIAMARGQAAMAEDYLRQGLAVKSDNFNRCFLIVNYMKLLIGQGRLDEAMRLTDTYATDVAKIYGTPLERQFLDRKLDYYLKKGDLKHSVAPLQRIVEIGDSLNSAITGMAMHEIAARYEDVSSQEKISRLEQSARNRLTVILVLAALLALAIACVLVLNAKRRAWRRAKAALNEKIAQLQSDHRDALAGSRLSLESNNRRLSSMSMLMSRLNDGLGAVSRDADDTSRAPEARLRAIKAQLADLDREENVWKMFRTYFESVNQHFFDRLYILAPTLTNAEIRMCAFILINLTTKEIAMMTNRSVRTVETIKHNLRKKLAIVDEPSEAFMRRISTAAPSEFDAILAARKI